MFNRSTLINSIIINNNSEATVTVVPKVKFMAEELRIDSDILTGLLIKSIHVGGRLQNVGAPIPARMFSKGIEDPFLSLELAMPDEEISITFINNTCSTVHLTGAIYGRVFEQHETKCWR